MIEKTAYEKLRTKVFGIIEGLTIMDSKYFNVRKALVFGESVHNGQRKDGSKEFSHQLEMLAFALSLHELLLNPYAVYMSIILHDLYEDYPERLSDIRAQFPEEEKYSIRLSKIKDQNLGTYFFYFNEIGKCEVCSVVKLIDRVHNLSTAPGVFSKEKLLDYCDEAVTYFFPMASAAKTIHNQRGVYEVLKNVLQIQINTIRKLSE